MGARTDFVIRPRVGDRPFPDGDLMVFATTSWWSGGRDPASAGGPASPVGFFSVDQAKRWVREQFSVPLEAWKREADGSWRAGKGDPPIR